MLTYYGDDFTGSTDVMESLTYGGIETVLFTRPPSDELLRRYGHVRAMGIAGKSRAMTPGEMDVELATAFETLLQHRPTIVHYKTCSTFDSSPDTGNIGRAIEIGMQVFQNQRCPLVVGAPVLQRFCVFGNLFARSGLDSAPFRLDRHPTMKCHPVTPMDEADLRVHLRRQTDLPIDLIDVLALDRPEFGGLAEIRMDRGIVLFDTLRDEHLEKIGQTVTEMQRVEDKPLFVAGSSGADYALVEHWKRNGTIDSDFRWTGGGKRQRQTLVVSGSCSPVTERQIEWGCRHGFVEISLETSALGDNDACKTETARATALAVESLQAGKSVVVHTSRGPNDARIEKTQATASQLGNALAAVLSDTLRTYPLSRVAVTGGDTSGHIASSLGVDVLEMVGPLAPGSPLCLARGSNSIVDGVEITFKGGQVGHDNFFETVLNGRP